MQNTFWVFSIVVYINYVLLLIKLQCLVIQFSFKWRTNLNVAPQSDILNPTLNEKGDASGVSMASNMLLIICVELANNKSIYHKPPCHCQNMNMANKEWYFMYMCMLT